MKRIFETKNVLDEREMQDLYRIEHWGLWLMYALLCASVVVQLLMGADFARLAGELVVIGVSSIALIAAYARYGIWDTHARPSVRGNAVYAAVSAVAVALVTLGRRRAWPGALLVGAGTFVLCFLLLTGMMLLVGRSQRQRERELEDE